MRSSTQMMPNRPRLSSMMSLEVMAVRQPSFLTNPRLYTNSRTDLRVGVPQVMWGSQILSMLMVALFSLTKTPLLICRRRKSWRAFLTLGATWLTPRMRMTKAYFSAFLKISTRFFLRATLFSRASLALAALLACWRLRLLRMVSGTAGNFVSGILLFSQ